MIRETAIQFEEAGHLNGVLTTGLDEKGIDAVVILVSAGFTSKTGPFRVYAELARELVKLNVATIRFDLGGIGNSEVFDTSIPLAERTLADIRSAVDFAIDRIAPKDIILGGICSGAEDSFRYAETDPRVSGVMLVDPHSYRTRIWWIRNVLSRHFVNWLVCEFLRIAGLLRLGREVQAKRTPKGMEGSLVDYKYMQKGDVLRILRALNRRKTKYYYLYTGGMVSKFNHRKQFYRMFPEIGFEGEETVTYMPEIQHTQVFKGDRRALIRTLCHWVKENFPGERASCK